MVKNIPILNVSGENIPEAWENSVYELNEKGLRYARGGRKDQGREQLDSTMTIEIRNPDSDIIYHMGATISYADSLIDYQFEMLGAKDFMVVNPEFDNPDLEVSTWWPYCYHERFGSYPYGDKKIDQIEYIVNTLCKRPSTRQSIAITWNPEKDENTKDPPCLQNLWFFLVPDGDKNYSLNMDYTFRSRNVMQAAFMNMFGLYTLQSYIRDKINEKADFKVDNGRMVDHSYSYHISAQDQKLLWNFMKRTNKLKEEKDENYNRFKTRKYFFPQLEDARLDIEEKMKGQLTNMCEDRKKRFPNKSKILDSILEKEIEKLRTISIYLENFLKKV